MEVNTMHGGFFEGSKCNLPETVESKHGICARHYGFGEISSLPISTLVSYYLLAHIGKWIIRQ
jgi:hypothetical protein